jgi:two-component system phosphate regulon sensor histidine kinase PhoR
VVDGDSSATATELQRLRAENERTFREAQLAADTLFAHYQLSQILASHETSAALAGAILDELMHLTKADGGSLWIHDPRSDRPVIAARRGSTAPQIEGDDEGTARVSLDDGVRRVGIVALSRSGDEPLDANGVEFLSNVRHELAVALRGAQLRESLDLERSELRAVFEGASDAIVLVDDHSHVVRANAAAGALLGIDTGATTGRTCDEVFACHTGPSDPCRDGCPFARVLATGEPIGGHERTLGAGVPEPVHVVGSYALASRSTGGSAMAVAVFHDTTQTAHLQELRRGFIATVSHELRTPLALIKGYVDTLLDLDVDPDTARSYLRRIDETTERLSDLVRQTLDVTQLAIGQLILERSPTPIADLIRGAVDDLRLQMPMLVVEVDLAEPMPIMEVDAVRIRQVLDNLLGNASKYGPPGGPLRVRGSVGNDAVLVAVEDDGVGIPADERRLVFEQFHRGRNVRESTLTGYGLGLSISRRIVEAHGGTLTLDPGKARGTRIVMRLPLLRDGAPGHPEP